METLSHLPKISIVTPSFNQGMFIEETINSVLSQNYPNLEYLIIDGGSTDNTLEVINRYSAHLTYWVSEMDNGFGSALNKGFSRSTGEIFAWVNSDDILLPGALLIVGKYFLRYQSTGLIFGNRHVIDSTSRLCYKRDYFFYFPGQLRFTKTFPQECTFWRKEVFLKSGPINEGLKFAVDFDLWCRIAGHARIRHIPFFLGAFRDQAASKSATIAATGLEERKSIIVKYFEDYPSEISQRLFNVVWGITRRVYKYCGITALKRAMIRSNIGV